MKKFLKTVLNVDSGFVLFDLSATRWSPSLQEKRQNDHAALPKWPLSPRALTVPEVSGRSRGNSIELLGQKPHLPKECQGVHNHQNRDPELLPQQPEPHRQALAACRHLTVQVTCPRGNKQKVGSSHGEDEDEEESVVSLTNAAVEKEAVMVVVFDAHVTQLAVLCAVGLEQLWGEQQRGQKNNFCLRPTWSTVYGQRERFTSQYGQNLWGFWLFSTRSAMQENRGSAPAPSSAPGSWVRTLKNRLSSMEKWTNETWARTPVGHTRSHS